MSLAMYRTPHRLFLSSAWASLNATAVRSPRTAFTRRTMSSESHSGHGSASSDRPWMIGSALVFGPLFLYLVSPSARKGSHEHTDHGHRNHHGEHQDSPAQPIESRCEEHVKPMINDEGAKVSGQEVKESMEKAIEANSPEDAREREEEVATETTTAVQTSATEVRPQGESLTDTIFIRESTWSGTPPTPVAADNVASVTSDKKAQTTASDTGESATQSKA